MNAAAYPRRIAVVGAGISGLAAAHALRHEAHVTLFEAEPRLGGHANTVDVTLPVDGVPVTHGVDTGFLVYNDRTYPQLIALFAALGVDTAESDMSFSVQAPRPGRSPLEWSGSNLATVFAQPSNLLSPRFLGMLADLLRFNRLTTRIALDGTDAERAEPLGEFLDRHRFGSAFREGYFLPMVGCIWSCPTAQMLQFPVATLIRFCHNHGLLQVADRPQWRTVRGGSRHYVRRIAAALDQAGAEIHTGSPVRRLLRTAEGVLVHTDAGTRRFDQLVLATHSDQALALLGSDADDRERAVLGAIRYHRNRAVLHTDTAVLPRRRAAWAAWNYERAGDAAQESGGVCLHYLINRLQPLPWSQPVIVSLNPVRPVARTAVMAEFDYAHPVFDLAALRAQAEVPALQGLRNTWFAGAWMGYGFHEDGLKAGLAAAEGVRQRLAAPGTAGVDLLQAA
ncbi:NAD(P)/FAD-dependent oxidoreductase [Xenophilus aerolatus]|nr:FAD-dependent oxidoreductase [Xenophilus aerolatus]